MSVLYPDLKTIIFDFDGTLVHFPFEYLFAETERILSLFKHPPVDLGIIKEAFSDFDYFRFVDLYRLAEYNNLELFKADFWREFNWGLFPSAEPFSATVPCLNSLVEAGFELAIATARVSTEHDLRRELELCGLNHFFMAVEGRNSEAQEWQDKSPQIFRVLESLSRAPKNAAMIGDIPADISSARTSGLPLSVAVLTGGIRRKVLERENPSLIIESLSELPSLLLGNNL